MTTNRIRIMANTEIMIDLPKGEMRHVNTSKCNANVKCMQDSQ